MGKGEEQSGYYVKQIMVRIPESDANILEDDARTKGTTLAAFCREILVDYVKNKNKTEDFRPIVREVLRDILKSEDLDGEFSEKVAKALAKKYQYGYSISAHPLLYCLYHPTIVMDLADISFLVREELINFLESTEGQDKIESVIELLY